jgi:hypothetical protein
LALAEQWLLQNSDYCRTLALSRTIYYAEQWLLQNSLQKSDNKGFWRPMASAEQLLL